MTQTALSLAVMVFAVSANAAAADMKTALSRATSKAFVRSGEVRCAQEVGQTLEMCRAGASQAETSVIVVVTFSNGFARMLMFEDGTFLRGNATMSGVGTDMNWRVVDGIYEIRVDDQRFDIPQTLVSVD